VSTLVLLRATARADAPQAIDLQVTSDATGRARHLAGQADAVHEAPRLHQPRRRPRGAAAPAVAV